MPDTTRRLARAALSLALLCALGGAAPAQEPTPTPTPSAPTPAAPAMPATIEDPTTEIKSYERLEWRQIGPANMGGRTTDVEGVPGDPNLVYVATASGGLWKTTNGGVRRPRPQGQRTRARVGRARLAGRQARGRGRGA